MTQPLELTVHRVIPASPEVVFNAWLDPEALARFMKPMPGMPDCEVETDGRVGGSFRIVMMAGDKRLPHHGEYKVVDRYERIVFTWLSEFSVPDSTVTLSFEAVDGGTRLTLHHTGFPSEESRSNHEGGWGRILEQLSASVA